MDLHTKLHLMPAGGGWRRKLRYFHRFFFLQFFDINMSQCKRRPVTHLTKTRSIQITELLLLCHVIKKLKIIQHRNDVGVLGFF